MIKPGQVWIRDPSMIDYWKDGVGKLVIVTDLSEDYVYYRYIHRGGNNHSGGSRSHENFLYRLKLIQDV
jgi:hypothetical protein